MIGALFRALSLFFVLLALPAAAVAAELVPYRIDGFEIRLPLTATPGDPVRGLSIVRDAANATCLICHTLPIAGEPDAGNIGPPLAGVGSRYTAEELRLRLVDPKVINPDTPMPAYYKVDGLHRVEAEFQGKSIYGAQDIEDVIAYLLTLIDP